MTRVAITLALTTLLAGGAWAVPQPRTYVGVVSDSMCRANHGPMKIAPDERCVRECVRQYDQVRYVLLDGTNVYVLSDQKNPARFAAKKVKVTGLLDAKTNTLAVKTIEPMQ